jgi:MFS family permease
MAYMTARYFELARYGFLYGMLNSAYFIGAAIGPAGVAASFDRYGNYHAAGFFLIVVLLFGLGTLPSTKDA